MLTDFDVENKHFSYKNVTDFSMNWININVLIAMLMINTLFIDNSEDCSWRGHGSGHCNIRWG